MNADRTDPGVRPGWLSTLARIAEPYRTERVAVLCILAAVWIQHEHADAAREALAALPWLVGAVAGRSAAHGVAGALGARRAPPEGVS